MILTIRFHESIIKSISKIHFYFVLLRLKNFIMMSKTYKFIISILIAQHVIDSYKDWIIWVMNLEDRYNDKKNIFHNSINNLNKMRIDHCKISFKNLRIWILILKKNSFLVVKIRIPLSYFACSSFLWERYNSHCHRSVHSFVVFYSIRYVCFI